MFQSKFITLFFVIVSMHLLLFFIPLKSPKIFERKKITVKTFETKSAPKILPEKVAIAKKSKHNPIQKAIPKTKNSHTKVVKKKQTINSSSLYQSLIEALENLDDKPLEKKTTSNLSIPHKIQNLQIEDDHLTLEKDDYPEKLYVLLQENLELPEKGEVKFKLTLSTGGFLLDQCVISSKSEKNKSYLKNQLPLLTFPCFNTLEKTRTYTILFR